MLKTIFYNNEEKSVVILDQNQLPERIAYESCSDHFQVAAAIKKLKVRGAPLIGVSAAFGLALALKNYSGPRENLAEYYYKAEGLFASTRPTAISLFRTLQRMRQILEENKCLSVTELTQLFFLEAHNMLEEDIQINVAISNNGQTFLKPDSQIMTVCNAGALATCGLGTALGVIRLAHQRGKLNRVWVTETRPVLQGARLTVWELSEDRIPVTLICDNMAAYTMSKKGIDAILVGADRIALNGDTANKIGTYSLAVLARHHSIPFYVAAPLSTIDTAIYAGQDILVEERDPDEIRKVKGSYITVPEVEVFNPAFDITPADLITAIITEHGIIANPNLEKVQAHVEKAEGRR